MIATPIGTPSGSSSYSSVLSIWFGCMLSSLETRFSWLLPHQYDGWNGNKMGVVYHNLLEIHSQYTYKNNQFIGSEIMVNNSWWTSIFLAPQIFTCTYIHSMYSSSCTWSNIFWNDQSLPEKIIFKYCCKVYMHITFTCTFSNMYTSIHQAFQALIYFNIQI